MQESCIVNQDRIRPPLAGWLGGKSLLAKRIIERIPPHTCYVEPFAGAAWVFFRKTPSEVEVLNDANLEIVTLYRVVQHHLEEFIRYFKWILVSRDEFKRMLDSPPETLTDIQRSARFWYLQQNSFGGKVSDQHFGYSSQRPPKLNLLRIEEGLSAAYLRLQRVYIERLPYQEAIQRYDAPTTFHYIDPPYWNCEEVYGKGLFSKADYPALASLLTKIKGQFLLSLNDTPEIRAIFSAFTIEEIDTRYSCSNKRNNRVQELLIRNF